MASVYRDVSGLAVSSSNGEAVELYNRVSFGYITARFSSVADLYKAIELDGSFVLPHCLMAYFMLSDLNHPDHPKVKPHLDALRSPRRDLTGREKRYVRAMLTYASGSLLDASVELEQLLLHYPTDGLALRMNNDSYIVLGENERMRNMLARALPHWSEDMPLYPFILALYAYALEECNHKDKGESMAKKALAIDSNVPLATHALAHIMEEERDAASGVEFLIATRQNWQDSTFGGHLTWHLALYHLDLGDTEAVLREFDSVLFDRATTSDKFALLDASSLLWRLNCLGLDPGEERWARVTSAMEQHIGNHRSPWFDSHIMMSLARGKVTESTARLALAQGMLKSMEEFSKNDDVWTCKISERLGVPVCTALLAFGQEQYDDVLSVLVPLRYDTLSLGGSWAQRQVYNTTMIQAAVRAGNTAMALGLVAELRAQKPKSKSLQDLFDKLMLEYKK